MQNFGARALFVGWVVVTLSLGAFGQDDIVIRKQARTQNPTLYLQSFAGPQQVRDLLVNDLTYSDWFTLQTTPDQADYILLASYSQLGESRELNIHLQDSQGTTVSHFRQRWQDNRISWLVHYAVDALILKVFENPGFCASQLAYVRQAGQVKEVCYSEYDGSNSIQLTHNGGLSVEPAWRPDGKYLMYTKYEAYSTSVVLVDLLRSEQRRILYSPGLNSGAAFSNDGRYAAMSLSKDGNVELYTKSLVDGTLRRLTRTRGVEASPTWSPDDRYICFVSDHYMLRPTLGIIPAQGGTDQKLLSLPFEAVSPDWSRVANKICFSLRQGRDYRIAVLDMNTQPLEPKIIVDQPGDWEAPAWAADGRHIICSRDYQGIQSLYLVDSWYGTVRALKLSNASLPSYSNRY